MVRSNSVDARVYPAHFFGIRKLLYHTFERGGSQGVANGWFHLSIEGLEMAQRKL